jgi:cupin superfamily acireductone dioxygenase involved in methionine salvage
VVFTQSAKTKPTTATYITKGQGTDRNIRTVDIGHENFSIGIIHRGKTVDGVQVKKQVKPGDIIIIPAGVVHGWVDTPSTWII